MKQTGKITTSQTEYRKQQ